MKSYLSFKLILLGEIMLSGLRRKFYLIDLALTLFAFVLWLISSFLARISLATNGMGELGLFSVLPVSYYISVAVLVFSFLTTLHFDTKNKIPVLLCQSLLLIVFLNLTPALIEGTARFTTSYYNFVSVDRITQTGYVAVQSNWVYNWPSFSILMSEFAQITSIPASTILLVYPTFFNILLLPSLLLFFRALNVDRKIAWIATWFVYFGFWTSQDYFSMQSIAFFISILILFLFFKNLNAGKQPRQWVVLVFLLFLYIVSSHFLTSLALITILAIFFLFRQLRRPFILIGFVLLVVSWTTFYAYNYLSENSIVILEQFLNLTLIFQRNIENRIATGSDAHILVAQSRVFYSLVMAFFGLLGFLMLLKNRKLNIGDKRVLILLIGLGALVFTVSYGGELFERVYMFSLLPLAYFAVRGSMFKKQVFVMLAIFLICLAPALNIIAHYGSETMDYVPTSEIFGVNFLYNSTTSGNVLGGSSLFGDMRDLSYHANYTLFSFRDVWLGNNSASLWNKPNDVSAGRYICISYETRVFSSYFLGDPSFINNIEGNITVSGDYDLLYSNPSLSIYYSRPLVYD